MKVTPPKNYLNNKDLLLEIHKSKSSFCSFTDPGYHQYDIILPSLSKINVRSIAEAKRNRAKRLSDMEFASRKASGDKIKLADCKLNYKKIPKTDLVFRIMSYDHIPTNHLRKKNPKTEADKHDKVNFKPFQHWIFDENDNLICVGKSHWKGDLLTGYFDPHAGKMTDTLAKMMMMMCERYATRGNVRGYSYNDEMKGLAILQLVSIGLQFDESKSDNPFAYLTTCVKNSFVRIINIEKRHREIRDDILEMNGLNPSYTRSSSGEYESSERRSSEDYD
jgi:hypothetical protein